ncbi:MAG: glycosyltransferase family 4 protein [Telluria sp.]
MLKSNPIHYLNRLMYRGTEDLAAEKWKRYFLPIPELSANLPAPILGVMLLIWQLRDKDLQARYPLKSKRSRIAFLAWCVVHGRNEYAALRESELFWESLARPAYRQTSGNGAANALSWLIVLCAHERTDLGFDLSTTIGRKKLLVWYLAHGAAEIGSAVLEGWQIAYLSSPSSTLGLNRLQQLIYEMREDVQNAFPLEYAAAEYLKWFHNFIYVETQIGAMLTPRPKQTGMHQSPGEAPVFGVNIFGSVFGQFGIGEDARMAGKALLSARVPMTMIDCPPGAGVSQNELEMAEFVGGAAVYSHNIFCMPALEHARCFAEKGTLAMRDRFNIGYWPWELIRWPDEWMHLLSLPHEIWVSSQHTFDAVAPVSPVSVRLMPMAVEANHVEQRTRASFGLTESATLFLFSFDLNSTTGRKNPAACVAAFLRAFPHREQANDVGLVIKVIGKSFGEQSWHDLLEIQRRDPRIHLIHQTLPRSEMLALYRICDCFISLHRAEGFGRCIAEAMLLGRPVITTRYSGNLDFTNESNSFLVDQRMKRIGMDEYPFSRGQSWADPSVAAAAAQMRLVARDPVLAAGKARRGQKKIQDVHGVVHVGQRYRKVLESISIIDIKTTAPTCAR